MHSFTVAALCLIGRAVRRSSDRVAIKHCTASRCVICHKVAQKHKMWLLQKYY